MTENEDVEAAIADALPVEWEPRTYEGLIVQLPGTCRFFEVRVKEIKR